MPQLAKGGKWVFGWVLVGPEHTIRIPPAAAAEYGFMDGMGLVFIRGSRTSGGFGLGSQELLTSLFPTPTRFLTQGYLQPGGTVQLPEEIGLKAGERLLAVRGSGHALGFLQRGPIYQPAQQHTQIEVFVS